MNKKGKGCINLEYPFEASWIWETDKNTVWLSMLTVTKEERRKGHTRKLIEDMMKKYKRVIIPNPSSVLVPMLIRLGFTYNPDFDPEIYDLWIKENTKNDDTTN